jgi:aspartate/methionine/tyrosine aminotransferase
MNRIFQRFEMERWQSTWEHQVEYNLTESGVHPLTLAELLGSVADLQTQSLGYSQTNGTVELRKAIASLYAGADEKNVLVTNGSAEANFLTVWSFLKRGTEIVMMLPNYMQIWGLSKNLGVKVKAFHLREGRGRWAPDLKALKRAVTKRTKLIAICNPNNPTGAVMTEEELEKICEIAKSVGSWILSDEVYQGAELGGKMTPSIWGEYKKVFVVNSLSKAYGLPGLRIGWIITTRDQANALWAYHDYTSIAPATLSDHLARRALKPEIRARILTRTREILAGNLPIIKQWVKRHSENLSMIDPQAGAIAYVKYKTKINSTHLAERLLREKSTLIVPGDHFGMDGYIRIGYGSPRDYLIAGLERVSDFLGHVKR